MFEISPDGRNLAIVGLEGNRSQLWIRPLDSGEVRLLPGTDGATYPFWSPDSAYVGFFADRKLKKIAVSGSSPQTLCDCDVAASGGTWNQEDVILFGGRPGVGLRRVSSAGGVPVQVTKAVPGDDQIYPVFLPGGRKFLYFENAAKPEDVGVYVGSLDGKPPVRILPDISSAVYIPTTGSGQNGYLLFRRGNALMAQPFDPAQAKLSGELFPVVEGVGISSNVGHGAFSAAPQGTLVYRSGRNVNIREMVWLDRSGKRLGVQGKPGPMHSLALSPDEKRVALHTDDPQGASDIWLLDVARGAMSRFTSGPGIIAGPVWSPDGESIAFSSRTSAVRDLYRKCVRGSGEQELLVQAAGRNAMVSDWSRNGKFLAYAYDNEKSRRDISLVPLDGGDRKPEPYVAAPYVEKLAQFSPDGKWMAYVTDESGRDQVYIRTIPPTRPPVQISIEGGSQPRWRHDGK